MSTVQAKLHLEKAWVEVLNAISSRLRSGQALGAMARVLDLVHLAVPSFAEVGHGCSSCRDEESYEVVGVEVAENAGWSMAATRLSSLLQREDVCWPVLTRELLLPAFPSPLLHAYDAHVARRAATSGADRGRDSHFRLP